MNCLASPLWLRDSKDLRVLIHHVRWVSWRGWQVQQWKMKACALKCSISPIIGSYDLMFTLAMKIIFASAAFITYPACVFSVQMVDWARLRMFSGEKAPSPHSCYFPMSRFISRHKFFYACSYLVSEIGTPGMLGSHHQLF